MCCSQEVEVALLSWFCLNVEGILANLVRVLARSRDFDTSTPVEVEVTKLVCQILQDCTVEVRSVIADEEVSRQNAALSGCLTDEEEIIEISFLIANNITVDNCAAWWILDR